MKVHVGCGDVYLDGYVNVDLEIPGYTFLSHERPDLVEQKRTTTDNYYKVEYTLEDFQKPKALECVVDRYGSMMDLDTLFEPDSVDEVRAVQCLEHLTRDEAKRALGVFHRILKPGGVVHVDVPDFEETVRQLLAQPDEASKEYYYRLVFGSQKNEWSLHKDGHSFPKLKWMLEAVGFQDVRELPNAIHMYPAVIAEARK